VQIRHGDPAVAQVAHGVRGIGSDASGVGVAAVAAVQVLEQTLAVLSATNVSQSAKEQGVTD
jgi:hypothetical protein